MIHPWISKTDVYTLMLSGFEGGHQRACFTHTQKTSYL